MKFPKNPRAAPVPAAWRGKSEMTALVLHGLRLLLLGLCAALLGTPAAHAEDIVAISSKVSKGYVRKKLPDGTFATETYAFGKGDDWSGARVDASIDRMDFIDVARVIGVPLAKQKYVPTRDQRTTNLLIMVYWGTTRAPEHASESHSLQMAHEADRNQDMALMAVNSALKNNNAGDLKVAKTNMAAADADMRSAIAGLQAEDQRREDTDMKTAALLGYDSWWTATNYAAGGGVRAYQKKDMLDELEEDRYFVVLMAYDFQELLGKKKSTLLWEAHISIREHSNQFDKRLAAMMDESSPFFGADSQGLHHLALPDGKVEVGPVKSLGVVAGN
jgi:hypothetical protein